MAPPCSSADLSGLVTFPQQLSLHLLLLQLYTAQAARAPCAPPCEIRHSAFTTGPAAVSIGGSVLECTGVYWSNSISGIDGGLPHCANAHLNVVLQGRLLRFQLGQVLLRVAQLLRQLGVVMPGAKSDILGSGIAHR